MFPKPAWLLLALAALSGCRKEQQPPPRPMPVVVAPALDAGPVVDLLLEASLLRLEALESADKQRALPPLSSAPVGVETPFEVPVDAGPPSVPVLDALTRQLFQNGADAVGTLEAYDDAEPKRP